MKRLFFLLSVFCLLAGPALAQTSSLLITEYLEGSGNNKALEIFNGTEDLISLGSYSIDRYSNGSSDPVNIPLDAVDLQPGEEILRLLGVESHAAAVHRCGQRVEHERLVAELFGQRQRLGHVG